MSVTAAAVMLLILLFGAPLLRFLPVPILTGIVIAALIGIVETKQAEKLWRTNRQEFFIFLTAFGGVLLFGTIYGVIIGVALSFFAVVKRAVAPPRSFRGVIAGHEGFYNLRRNRSARPVRGTVIYRFSGNLFFANIETFQNDLENAIQPDTKQIIVDAGGIGSIDSTAVERLLLLEKSLRERGIRLYLTEHVGKLNDELRALGAEALLENGSVRRTVELALRDCGLEPPYPREGSREETAPVRDESESYAEFEWLYGEDAEEKREKLARELAELLSGNEALSLEEIERRSRWGRVGLLDENTLLDYVELELEQKASDGELGDEKLEALENRVEELRPTLEDAVTALPSGTQDYMSERAKKLRERMASRHPEQFARLQQHRDRLSRRRRK